MSANHENKPLHGIRVLELGGYIAAPYATSLLTALGADVIKVEKPVQGDDFRRADNEKSPYFRQYNQGKRSLAIDIKSPEGVALVRKLIPSADVIVENLRPGKLASIGLGPEECMALNPKLVYASITGFGDGGPLRLRAAYDTIGQAAGGLYSILSDAGNPQLSGTCMGDLVSGLVTVTGVLAALVRRGFSGSGERVETSLMEAVSAITVDAITQYFDDDHTNPSRQSRHPQGQNFVIQTAAGEPIAIHLSSSQKFWRSFVAAMERPELLEDPRFATYPVRTQNYFELADIVLAEARKHDTAEWERRLEKHDVPFSPVLSISGYHEHPQVQWLDMFEPEVDGVAMLRPPWKFNGERPARDGDTPRVGRDTLDIAAEVCDEAELAALLAAGVLYVDEVAAESTPAGAATPTGR